MSEQLIEQLDELDRYLAEDNFPCAMIQSSKLRSVPAALGYERYFIADIRCLYHYGQIDEAQAQLNCARTLWQLGLLK